MTKTLKDLAHDLGEVLEQKNEAYGDAVGKSAAFLTLLYPNGIPVEAYGAVSLQLRIFDKQCRIANKPDAFGEDPFLDIGGYGLLGQRMVLDKGKTRGKRKVKVGKRRCSGCNGDTNEPRGAACWVCFLTNNPPLPGDKSWQRGATTRELTELAKMGIK